MLCILLGNQIVKLILRRSGQRQVFFSKKCTTEHISEGSKTNRLDFILINHILFSEDVGSIIFLNTNNTPLKLDKTRAKSTEWN